MPNQLALETSVESALTARELLYQAFQILVADLQGQEVKFTRPAFAEIANDDDYHRRKKGYSGYKTAFLTTIGSQTWILAFGEATGDYPALSFNCDIAAVPFQREGKDENNISAEVHRALQNGNEYHVWSLLCALADDSLTAVTVMGHGRKILTPLKLRIDEFKSVVNKTETACYKPEAVPFLVEIFKSALV